MHLGRTRGLSARLALVFLTCLGLAGWPSRAAAQTPWTWEGYFELVTSYMGTPTAQVPADGPSRASRHPVSQDGRYVVFESEATNLIGPPGVTTIYRRDRLTRQLTFVQAGWVRNAAISADGSHVAYEQCGTGWASPCQIWSRHVAANGNPVPLSLSAGGAFGNGDSATPTLSLTGRYVVYVTTAQNITNDVSRRRHIVWRDRDTDADGVYDETGAVAVQVITLNGAQLGNGDSDTPEVSDDGRFVAFRSAASNLVAGDTNGAVDVFLRDRNLTTHRRLNVRPGNVQSPDPIVEPHISMSGNGQFVAFASADPLLTSGVNDTNGTLDVFVYQGTTTLLRVDVGRNGGFIVPGNGPTGWPTLSSDGRYMSLQSTATNAPFLSQAGTIQVYAVDRQLSTVTRISGMPDGTEPDASSVQPSITAGGSLVVFWSQATTFTGCAVPAFSQLHAAARLNVFPDNVQLPASGGLATVRVAAHTYTPIFGFTNPATTWLTLTVSPNPPENNQLRIEAPANDGIGERSAVVHVGTRTVTVTQPAALTLTSVSPASGPSAGGTTITLHGSGFVPGMQVYIGSAWLPTTFVDAGTLTAVTPGGMFGPVLVGVETPDQQASAWLEGGFSYDGTPPELIGVATGPVGQDGWFVGDVTVSWTMSDGESPITSTTCTTNVVTADTPGTWFECSATSTGGTTTAWVFVKRDATPPTITVTSPRMRQLVEPGALLTGDFTCNDTVSGIVTCGFAAPSGAPLETQTAGWHQFVPAARDAAGNLAAPVIEYAVSGSACVAPVQGLTNWNRFEDNLEDTMFWLPAYNPYPLSLVFAPGVAGRSYQMNSGAGRLKVYTPNNRTPTSGLSVAMWLEPATDTLGRVLDRLSQFGLRRDAAGTLTWTLYRLGGGTETGTSTSVVPSGAWTHVALTYDAGVVTLYLNGRADRTWTVDVPELALGSDTDVHVGGPMDWANPYVGKLDELQLFDRAISAADVEAIFLSGSAGTCRPAPTTLTVLPSTATFGDGTFPSVAVLRDANGEPIAGRSIRLDQLAVPYGTMPPSTYLVTDADGRVTWDAPFSVGVGYYYTAVRAHFEGDLEYAHTNYVAGTLQVRSAPSEVTWTPPAPIVYGTGLSAVQLNAVGNRPGTYSYTPYAGTVLPVGTHTLQVWFHPTDTNYGTSTASVTIDVGKALPTMVLANATVTYNGQPRPVSATARSPRGDLLSPVTVTYNGASTAPSAVGIYAVVASFPGDANHLPNTGTATLTITKATPAIAFSTPTSFTFDGQPHGVVATVTGIGGSVIGTVPVTYSGAPAMPVDAGTYTASATFDGNESYTALTATTTVTIAKATPSIIVAPQPATFTYDGQPHAVTATVTGVGGADLGTLAVTYDGSATPPVNAGNYWAQASFPGNANYVALGRSVYITIQKATPSIVFAPQPATFTYDGQPHALTASAVGVDGTSLGAAAVSYPSPFLPPVNAGTWTVSATFAGNANYTSHTATTPLTITGAAPLVTVSGGPFVYDGMGHLASVTVRGVDGQPAGGSVTVTYNGGTAAPVAAGTYAVAVSVAASGNYAATSATGTIVIEPATPALYWIAPAPIPYGTPLSWRQLNAYTSVEGTFVYSPADGTVLDVGAGQTLTATFTSSNPNYRDGSVTRTLTVERAAPSVWMNPEFYNYDGQPHPITSARASGVGFVPLGPLTLTYDGSPVPPVNAGAYTVTATFDGDARYLPASGTGTLTINKAMAEITWRPPVSMTYGTPLDATYLNATASVPGTFTYTPAAGTVLDASAPSAQILRATFTPVDTQNYAERPYSAAVWVYRAMPAVTATGGTFPYDGQPHAGSGSATGVGGVVLTPVSVTYNDSPDVPVAAGTYTVLASYAGDTNYSPRTTSATLVITRAPVTLSWAQPAAIGYGTPLSAAQLNATASVPGTFSYSQAAGAVLDAGTTWVTATFTPADPNFSGGTTSRMVTVSQAAPTVTVTGGSFGYDGQPHAATASVTGIGGEDLGAATLTYNGSATAPSAVGTYTVVASYAGSVNYAPSSQSTTLTIGKATPVLSWTPPASLPYGPTLGPTQLNAQSSVAGTFSYSPGVGNRLPAGTHTLTATFTPADGTSYTGGTVTTSITIVPAALEIRTVDTVKAFSSSLPMFTATFTGLASGQTIFNLSGTLTFATAATATSPVGTYAVTPGGLSSPNYVITYVSGTLTVVKVPVALTIAASPTPSGLDMPITFSATVSGTQGVAIPAGVVRFLDGTTLLGTATLSNGAASLLTGGLTAGSHTIEARFDGDASFEAGTIAATHIVNTAAATPAITIASSRQPASNGQAVTLTATITVATSGTIGFYDGNTLLGTGSISGGAATLTTGFAAGSHAITARFQGSASAPPVISPVFVQAVTSGGWKDRTSSVSLVSSANPSALGGTVTFTATASGSSGTPTGRILFMVDGLVVGDPTGVAVSGSGQASVSIATLNGGRHKVTATYLGSSNYRGSNAALTQTVN